MTEQAQQLEQSTDELLDGIGAAADELEKKAEGDNSQAQALAEAEIMETTAASEMVVGVAEMVITMIWPMVEYAEEQKRQAVQRLQPLFMKYGISTGGRWADEINAAIFFGVTAFSTWQQVQIAKQEAKDGGQSEHNAA